MRYTQRPLQIKYLYRKHRKCDTHGYIVRTMKKTCTFSPNQNIHLSSLAAEGNVSRKFLKENDLFVSVVQWPTRGRGSVKNCVWKGEL